MKHAGADSAVEFRLRQLERRLGRALVALADGKLHILDEGADTADSRAIDFFTAGILPDPFFGGFMSGHGMCSVAAVGRGPGL